MGSQKAQKKNDSKRRYVGRCIYCGATGKTKRLTDEHVAPAGLAGDYVLVDASCKDCAKITGYFEGKTLRGLLGPVREHEGIQSGRRKKRPPMRVGFENPDGRIDYKEIDLFAHPYTLVLPELPPAGILTGADREAGFPATIETKTHTNDAARRRMKKLIDEDPQHRQTITKLDFGNFTKFLAKIAYCFSIFFFDCKFEPLVVDLILAPRDDAVLGPYFVGRAIEQAGLTYPPQPKERIFSTVVRVEKIDSRVFLIARIHLFNDRGMPVYDVVVGTTSLEVEI